MSREIKFRVWDGGKVIYEKDISHILLEDGDILRLARFFCNVRNDCKVMQYIGRKDKNGVEIYEGDILRLHEYSDVEVPVVFHKGAFCVKGFNWDEKTAEVIGNIYSNPELLK